MIKKTFFALLFLLIVKFNYSQAPVYSNEFLSIGVDAKAISLANTCIATVSDVSAGYWNPAGLVNLKRDFEIGLMHNEYFGGISSYNYGAIAIKIDSNSAIGFSYIRMSTDNIPNTLDLIDNDNNINYDKVSSFSVADNAIFLSYARKSNKIQGLRYGASAKYIFRYVGDFGSSKGFGLDVGAQYNYKKWIFGLMCRDITSTFNAWTYNTETFADAFTRTGNTIPKNSVEVTLPKIIIGAAREFKLPMNFNALTEINVDFTTDGQRNVLISSKVFNADPHLGIQIGYKDFVFIRGGLYNIQKVKDDNNKSEWTFQPNFGIGFKIIDLISIDYALSNFSGNKDQGNIVPLSNIFSLKVSLDKKILKSLNKYNRTGQIKS
ncbi:MAG: PorV/PorQ family protein [Bacteroidota bacterium]|nr:PorV/PorQ family protein [Bacteroidota bacterium]